MTYQPPKEVLELRGRLKAVIARIERLVSSARSRESLRLYKKRLREYRLHAQLLDAVIAGADEANWFDPFNEDGVHKTQFMQGATFFQNALTLKEDG